MPINVTKEVKTDELRPNDVVIAEPKDGSITSLTPVTVRTIDRKTKWTTVVISAEDALPVTRRVLGDDVWTVVREEETQEEKDAKRRTYYLGRLHDQTNTWLADPARELEAKIAKNREAEYVELAGHWEFDQFLTAQAFYKIARSVMYDFDRIRDNEKLPVAWRADEDEILITAWANWYLRNVLDRRSSSRNPLSRSTSITSNLFEDLDTWATQSIVDEGAWHGFTQLVKPRALELRAFFDGDV